MKLGVTYNVFDGEELLESSIESIRASAHLVVVVWQRVSNFGEKNETLGGFLAGLKKKGIVDHLIEYTPRTFSSAERRMLVSRTPEGLDGSCDTVGPQFFHEITKRELGRQYLLDKGCTHYLLMDTDEFYRRSELDACLKVIWDRGFDTTACRMRLFLKEPIYEYFPYDNFQAVPFVCKLLHEAPLRLAAPVRDILTDPTRRQEPMGNFFFFDRGMVEMYHMTFVRKKMARKLRSVSNKANYVNGGAEFLEQFEQWRGPPDGPIHPHATIGRIFTRIKVVPNYFGVDLAQSCDVCCTSPAQVCDACSRSFCSASHHRCK